jgi:hypothetical protein
MSENERVLTFWENTQQTYSSDTRYAEPLKADNFIEAAYTLHEL